MGKSQNDWQQIKGTLEYSSGKATLALFRYPKWPEPSSSASPPHPPALSETCKTASGVTSQGPSPSLASFDQLFSQPGALQ
jgi:hypothetical protein